MIMLLSALMEPQVNEANLMVVLHQLQIALPPVHQDTVVVPTPFQVRDLRKHNLGVGVAGAPCPVSLKGAVQHLFPQEIPSPISTLLYSPVSSRRILGKGLS